MDGWMGLFSLNRDPTSKSIYDFSYDIEAELDYDIMLTILDGSSFTLAAWLGRGSVWSMDGYQSAQDSSVWMNETKYVYICLSEAGPVAKMTVLRCYDCDE